MRFTYVQRIFFVIVFARGSEKITGAAAAYNATVFLSRGRRLELMTSQSARFDVKDGFFLDSRPANRSDLDGFQTFSERPLNSAISFIPYSVSSVVSSREIEVAGRFDLI